MRGYTFQHGYIYWAVDCVLYSTATIIHISITVLYTELLAVHYSVAILVYIYLLLYCILSCWLCVACVHSQATVHLLSWGSYWRLTPMALWSSLDSVSSVETSPTQLMPGLHECLSSSLCWEHNCTTQTIQYLANFWHHPELNRRSLTSAISALPPELQPQMIANSHNLYNFYTKVRGPRFNPMRPTLVVFQFSKSWPIFIGFLQGMKHVVCDSRWTVELWVCLIPCSL